MYASDIDSRNSHLQDINQSETYFFFSNLHTNWQHSTSVFCREYLSRHLSTPTPTKPHPTPPSTNQPHLATPPPSSSTTPTTTTTMPPPSQLTIATSSLLRLLKEETSYHTEQASQEARLDKLQQLNTTEDENIEYEIRQQVRHVPLFHRPSNVCVSV